MALDAVKKFSNNTNSSFKVPSTPRGTKALAANPQDDAAVRCTNIGTTTAAGDQPVNEEAPAFAADFYRFGQKVTQVDPLTGQRFTDFAVQPRAFDEISPDVGVREDLASIKLQGTVNGKANQNLIPPYSKFLLQSVNEGHQERHQIVETFGDFFVFFYGERPPIYNFSGILINGQDINWLKDFMFFYNNFFRGTKAVELSAKIVLTYQGRQIEGFILNTSNVTQAESQNGVSITFQVVVTKRFNTGQSLDFGLIEQDGTFTQAESLLQLLQRQGLSKADVDRAFQAAQRAMEKLDPPNTCKPVPASAANELTIDHGLTTTLDGSGLTKLGLA